MTIDSTVQTVIIIIIIIIVIKSEDLEHDCKELNFNFCVCDDVQLEYRVPLLSSEEGGQVVVGFVIIGTEFSQARNF